MQQIWDIWKAIFGKNLLILFFVILCLITVSVILYQGLKSKVSIKKLILISAICMVGFIFAWRQPYLPEKAHVLEFGLLGWLAMRDLSRQRSDLLKSAWVGFVFVTIVGCLEEGFQRLLPWRVFEIRDIITDALGGILGIILYPLTQTRFSSFIRSL